MKTANRLVAAVATVGCLVVSASALQVQVGPGYGPYQTGQGGEFSLAVVSGTLDLSGYSSAAATQTRGLGWNADSFQSFCIEDGTPPEYIYQNQVMDAVQSTSASYGSQPTAGDRISVGTGWLYSQFAKGTLAGYDYSAAGRHNSAAMLQQAIWLLEGESGGVNNGFALAVSSAFGSLANAKADGGEQYGVYALNLTYGPYNANNPLENHRQDQLYYDGHSVPDGGMTLALLGFAMAGLAGLRRRLS